MPIETLKKIWVSCHLLFPNASQARDIFGIIMETGVDQSSTEYGQVFQGIQKLYRIYKQRDAVPGTNTFEFTAIPLNYWKRVLLKCNKDETFIVMAALLDFVSFKDISRITKIPQTKARYLFNQSIKKVISSPLDRVDQKKEIKFKEYNTNDVTALFISEHMIEYVLGISDSFVGEKMEAKLKDNNRYSDYRSEILKFKAELTDLTVSQHFDEVIKVFGNTAQLNNLKKIEVKQQKRIFIGLVALIIIVIGLILRPAFLKAPMSEATDKKVVLEEIAISKNATLAEHAENEAAIAEAQTIVASATPVVSASIETAKVEVPVSAAVVAKVDDKKAAAKKLEEQKAAEKKALEEAKAEEAKAAAAAKIAAAKASEVKEPEEKSEPPAKLVKPTGVYRGTITVTDFDQVIAIIRDRIVNIGGKKAGEVELGWIKNKNISYFHFVFPAEKREELVSFIEQYGHLQYKFEPHPRVLPIGQSRFIIEVYKGE